MNPNPVLFLQIGFSINQFSILWAALMLVLKEADALHFMVIQYSIAQWCSTAPAAEYVIRNMLYMCTLPLKDL